jgi:hypothetical protein
MIAALISTMGFNKLQPWLERKVSGGNICVAQVLSRFACYQGMYDACGVHNLHGMPGIFAGLVSVLAVSIFYRDVRTRFLGVFSPGF